MNNATDHKKKRSDTKESKRLLWKWLRKIRNQARHKFRSLSEDKKNEKREYGRNRYNNMSKGQKQEQKEYQKNYREAKKLKWKMLTFFPFHCIKHGTRSSLFRRKWHHQKCFS